MTMIAGCRFRDGVIIIADSRVTWEKTNGEVHCDNAQKILSLGSKLAIAFAGRVNLADQIINELRKRLHKNTRLRNPVKLSTELPRIARFYFRIFTKKYPKIDWAVVFILAGVDISENIFLWKFKSPDFVRHEITEYAVLGSGEVVASYLQNNYLSISNTAECLKDRANILLTGLESELQKHGLDTVGGLFQIILISSIGISPMTYGFMDLNPELPGKAKETTFTKGIWTQKDLAGNKELSLAEPRVILTSLPKEGHFHDYVPIKKMKELRWYLNYFITCLRVARQQDKTRFEGVLSEAGAHRYPRIAPILVSIGFWGPRGDYNLRIYLDDCSQKKLVHEDKIHIEYPSEQREIDVMLQLPVEKAGPVFINCHIDNYLLGRKALYFGEVKSAPPQDKAKFPSFFEEITRALITEHRKCSDPLLQTQPCFLEYFVLCQKFLSNKSEYEFINETKSVYSKKYPLSLRIFIISAFRFAKGQHNVRIDLVNAVTHSSTTITSDVFEGRSECIITPAEGDLIAQIPEPGFYYFNLYVDNQFISSILLAAETNKPKYSYSLRKEDLKRVEAGEVLILLKGSQRAND